MTSPSDEIDTNQQVIRAELRKGFLQSISELIGQPCEMMTYECSKVKGTFTGWKPDGSEILVTDMTTPTAAEISSALLRGPDIISVHFDSPS